MNRIWNMPFIGRDEEIKTILEHVSAWGTKRIIFISGAGGIGKTRLLNEVGRILADQNEKVKVPPIFDFDDDRYKNSANIRFSLARELGSDAFQEYLDASREMRLAEQRQSIDGEAKIRRKVLEVDRLFIRNYNAVSSKSRILLRFDTTDAFQDDSTMSLSYLFDGFAYNVENTVLLIAGRNADALYVKYSEIFGADVVHLPLMVFEPSTSRKYFEEKRRKISLSITEEQMEKVMILTGRVPILLDLAIEQIQTNYQLLKDDDISLADLRNLEDQQKSHNIESREQSKKKLENIQKEFLKKIIYPSAHISNNLDHLKIILAKIYPLDVGGVEVMLKITHDEAIRVVEQATQSVAFKLLPDGKLQLHDEIKRLINENIWLDIDSDKNWNQKENEKAIKYLSDTADNILAEIRLTKDTEEAVEDLSEYVDRSDKELRFWLIRYAVLRYQLENDVEKGLSLFYEYFNQVKEEFSALTYRLSLISLIEPYASLEQPMPDLRGTVLSQEQRLDLTKINADEARFNGMYKVASDLYENLLTNAKKNTVEYLDLLIGQSNLKIRSGNLQQALSLGEQALAISQENKYDDLIGKSKFEIGYIYRLMGNLGQAHEYYTEALQLALNNNNEEQIPKIYDGLAYVHALNHQDKALDEIKYSNKIWQDLVRKKEGLRFHLGRSYNTAGEVCIELERPDDALSYFGLSWAIFEQGEASALEGGREALEWKSRSRTGRGFAYWLSAIHAIKTGNNNLAENDLGEALENLNWAYEYCTRQDEPNVLNRRGEVFFSLKEYAKCEEDWTNSFETSRKTGDAFTEFYSLSNLARLALLHPIKYFSTWEDFDAYYKRDFRKRHSATQFYALNGLFNTYLGNLSFKNGEIESAIKFYEIGFLTLAKFGTYGDFNLVGQLEYIEKEVFPLVSPNMVKTLATTLTEIGNRQSFDVTALIRFRNWANYGET